MTDNQERNKVLADYFFVFSLSSLLLAFDILLRVNTGENLYSFNKKKINELFETKKTEEIVNSNIANDTIYLSHTYKNPIPKYEDTLNTKKMSTLAKINLNSRLEQRVNQISNQNNNGSLKNAKFY